MTISNHVKKMLTVLLVILGLNTFSFSATGLFRDNQTVAPIVQVISIGQTTAYAEEGIDTRGRLDAYEGLIRDNDLTPDFSSARGVLKMFFKFAALFMGILGTFLVLILTVRVFIDLFIVGLGWEPDDEVGGIQALVFGLSSFGKISFTSQGSKGVSFNAKKGDNAEIPDDIGQYFREYWFNIVVSFVAAGVLISGQIFAISLRGLELASVVVDMFAGFDTDRFTQEAN